MPKTDSAVAKSKKAGALASSGKSRKAAEDAKGDPFSGHENLHKWEVEAIGHYQGQQYKPINELLRGQRPSIISSIEENIPKIDRAIAKTILAADVTLFRGTSTIRGVDFRKLEPGHIVTDLGFHSTSISQAAAEKFVGMPDLFTGNPSALITIKAKKGQKALAVHKLDTGSQYQSGKMSEFEVLLPRGSTFKVLSVKPRKDGNLHITMSLQ
jgi:hypothetical protein